MNESNIKFFSRTWVCRLLWHSYCKCGFCLKNPECIRCGYKPFQEIHSFLSVEQEKS